jgi:hypothetical protein
VNVDKRHHAGALMLLVAAIAYNVWAFTRPSTSAAASRSVRVPAPVDALPAPTVAGASAPAPSLDPAQIPPVPDVALDLSPQWPRNPFENPRRVVLPAVIDAAPVAPPPEPEVVVATILYSPQRRLAMVNGRIAAIGDKVGSATIVDIQPKAIVLDSPTQGRRTIALRPSLTRREGS